MVEEKRIQYQDFMRDWRSLRAEESVAEQRIADLEENWGSAVRELIARNNALALADELAEAVKGWHDRTHIGLGLADCGEPPCYFTNRYVDCRTARSALREGEPK